MSLKLILISVLLGVVLGGFYGGFTKLEQMGKKAVSWLVWVAGLLLMMWAGNLQRRHNITQRDFAISTVIVVGIGALSPLLWKRVFRIRTR